MLTGDARGKAEYPELQQARTTLIAVTASFGGLALFIAIFVVASTMGLSIQQREREIALLRAVAATPGQIRRMIAWEAAIVGLVGSAAGIWPGAILGRALADGLVDHGIAPPNLVVGAGTLPIAAAIAGGVLAALLAVLAAGRRAARVPPTHALTVMFGGATPCSTSPSPSSRPRMIPGQIPAAAPTRPTIAASQEIMRRIWPGVAATARRSAISRSRCWIDRLIVLATTKIAMNSASPPNAAVTAISSVRVCSSSGYSALPRASPV